MNDHVGARRWAIVALAFAAVMLNYVDRQIIALLKPTLQVEFGWSDRDYSHMASAFQFCAAVSFLGTGWFIDRIGLRRGFAIGVGLWSLAGMAHAVVGTVGGFVGVRAALGAAESIGTPAQVKTASTYFPPERRSLMLGIGNMTSNFGAVLAPLSIPALALWLGWRAAFVLTGGLGLLWVGAWLLVTPRTGRTAAIAERGARMPWNARPLLLDWEDDPGCWGLETQFAYGRDLIVAPVIEPDRERWTAYLPAGARWVHLWSGDRFDGGAAVDVAAPIGRPPVFWREGSAFAALFTRLGAVG